MTDSKITRLFLSYSRKDAKELQKIVLALRSRGYDPDFDKSEFDPNNVLTGISAEDEWWKRLQQLIARADVMIFLVSPDSASSRVCDEEIAYARGLAKRIIPVLCRRVDFAKAPPRLSALNVKIDFTANTEETFEASVNALEAAIETNVTWQRELRRLTELAVTWDIEGRPGDRSFNVADVRAAEVLFQSRPSMAEPPPLVLTDFLDHSRTLREKEARHLRQVTGRAFVSPADQAVDDGEPEHAIRLAAAGVVLAHDPDFSEVPELWSPIERAILAPRTTLLYKGHEDGSAVSSALYSPDGRFILSVSEDASDKNGTARVWDAVSGAVVAVFRSKGSPMSYGCFSPDGCRIATAHGDGMVRLWDVISQKPLKAFTAHADHIHCLAFSPNGKFIVTGSDDGLVKVWNSDTCQSNVVLDDHDSNVLSARFSADSSRLLTAGYDAIARVWDADDSFLKLAELKHDSYASGASFSLDGRWLVVGCADFSAYVWSAETFKLQSTLTGHRDWVNDAAFCNRGTRVVTASSDRTARVWSAENGKEVARLNGHQSGLTTCMFSKDDRHLLTASIDGTARIWQLSNLASIELSRELALLASLADGVGLQTEDERSHLLLQGAPIDLFEGASKLFGMSLDDQRVRNAVKTVRGGMPVHRKYINTTGDVVSTIDMLDDGPSDLSVKRSIVTDSDMIGQEFIESRDGVSIFLLADGRHHVIGHCGVATIEDARTMAKAMGSKQKV